METDPQIMKHVGFVLLRLTSFPPLRTQGAIVLLCSDKHDVSHASLFVSLSQREFGGQARAEELQGPAGRPYAAFLWPLPGELLRPVCDLPGVCGGKASGPTCSHIVQSFQYPLEVSTIQ